jgi:hypothetical protein
MPRTTTTKKTTARATRAKTAHPRGKRASGGATKLDLRKELGALYAPGTREPSFVDVPSLRFLMIDGEGDPNSAPSFRAAIEALYSVSYTLKFAIRKRGGPDYTVMPLEGLWWADDMSVFRAAWADKSGWKWTAMIHQPEVVTPKLFEEAKKTVVEKKGIASAAALRLETLKEGPAAQILFVGPYAKEGPAIEAVHQAIAARGGRLTGKHHEIYLNSPGRTAPERLRTIIRQPYAGTAH